ncbi:hypothetical protein WR25_06288 [Diploscapter pachys]|uniref:Uncharacterized protein n=1 Tax=Diploscapter pachys TaxID=2018661 RepID=A0A2A2LRP7_9BILA|nr:hypothetical protein WR25_06288 [Diploscapter pachys]
MPVIVKVTKYVELANNVAVWNVEGDDLQLVYEKIGSPTLKVLQAGKCLRFTPINSTLFAKYRNSSIYFNSTASGRSNEFRVRCANLGDCIEIVNVLKQHIAVESDVGGASSQPQCFSPNARATVNFNSQQQLGNPYAQSSTSRYDMLSQSQLVRNQFPIPAASSPRNSPLDISLFSQSSRSSQGSILARDDDVFGPGRFSPRLASTQDDSVYLQPQHKATQTDPLPDGLQLALEKILSKPEEVLRKMQMLMHNEHFFNMFEQTKNQVNNIDPSLQSKYGLK